MIVLGIEATAHTFGVGIVDCKKRQVLFNEKSQFKGHEGMDLRKLSDFHVANFDLVLKNAKLFLESKKMSFEDVDLISFSRGPGIGNSLKIGALCAKTLALKYNKPIVGVNHIKAHLEIGKWLTRFEDPLFLYVSGVNTQVIAKEENSGKYKIYGETEDIGLGNLLDSFGRLVGLDFPSGAKIEQLALNSNNFIELPYTVKGMNVSLAGVYSNLKKKHEEGVRIEDMCFSLQETTFAMVMEICERAMAYTNKSEFIIVGGVASNKRLTKMAEEMCKIRGAKYKSFPMEYAMDNGAMIAVEGFLRYSDEEIKRLRDKTRKINIKDLKPMPYINIESEI